MILASLPTYITIPDHFPSCEICGCRGKLISNFQHTNFRGSFYDCPDDITHRFIDQEDDYFTLEYWEMDEEEREAYETS